MGGGMICSLGLMSGKGVARKVNGEKRVMMFDCGNEIDLTVKMYVS